MGENKDSRIYIRLKKRMAAQCGFFVVEILLDECVEMGRLLAEVDALNDREDVHCILVQLPLPSHINERVVLRRISIMKDVDGFSPENIGNIAMGRDTEAVPPGTPLAILTLIERTTQIEGKRAVVIGRSNTVGLPTALMLMRRNATVTICHSKTSDLPAIVREADIVVSAVGKPLFVRGSWLKPSCVVIDVGITDWPDPSKKAGYRLVGDVHFEEARAVASHITPVPGELVPCPSFL